MPELRKRAVTFTPFFLASLRKVWVVRRDMTSRPIPAGLFSPGLPGVPLPAETYTDISFSRPTPSFGSCSYQSLEPNGPHIFCAS